MLGGLVNIVLVQNVTVTTSTTTEPFNSPPRASP